MTGAEARRVGSIAGLTFAQIAIGLNVFLIGKAAPLVAASFAIPMPAITPVFFAQQLGLVAGAIGSGIAAARFGRRRLITVGLFIAGVLGVAIIRNENLAVFAALRMLAGLCLGLVGPALIAEAVGHAAPRWRSIALSTVLAGNVAGAGGGFILIASTSDGADWRRSFAIAGAALIVGAVMAGASREPPVAALASCDQSQRRSLVSLLAIDHRRASLSLAACFMISLANNAVLATWLVSYFDAIVGISAQKFAEVGMFAIPSAVAGMLGVGVVARIVPRPLLIVLVFGGHAVALALLGLASFGSVSFLIAFTTAAALQAAGQGLLNLTLVDHYPEALRTTALGGAAAIGRIGGLAAPWLGMFLFDGHLSLAVLFMLLALVPLLVGFTLTAARLNQPKPARL